MQVIHTLPRVPLKPCRSETALLSEKIKAFSLDENDNDLTLPRKRCATTNPVSSPTDSGTLSNLAPSLGQLKIIESKTAKASIPSSASFSGASDLIFPFVPFPRPLGGTAGKQSAEAPIYSDETIHDPVSQSAATYMTQRLSDPNLDIETYAALSTARYYGDRYVVPPVLSRTHVSETDVDISYGTTPGYIPRGRIQKLNLLMGDVTPSNSSFYSARYSTDSSYQYHSSNVGPDALHLPSHSYPASYVDPQSTVPRTGEPSNFVAMPHPYSPAPFHNLNGDIIVEEALSQRESTATAHARKAFSFKRILSLFGRKNKQRNITKQAAVRSFVIPPKSALKSTTTSPPLKPEDPRRKSQVKSQRAPSLKSTGKWESSISASDQESLFYMDASELRRGSVAEHNRARSVRIKSPKKRLHAFGFGLQSDAKDGPGRKLKRSLSADDRLGSPTPYALQTRPSQSRRPSGVPHSSTSSVATTTKSHVVETSVIYAKSDSTTEMFYNPYGHPEISRGKVNQYHILRDIGSGAFGRVVLVRNEKTGVYHACKVISKAFLMKKFRFIRGPGTMNGPPAGPAGSAVDPKLTMIQREIAVLKKLSKHPNIVNLVEVLDDAKEDNIYMIFDLCEYGPVMNISIGQVVEPFSEEVARGYFRDIVLGLEYLHYKKIVHSDLKPENLLLTSDHVVQIADFGISHMFEDDDEEGLLPAKNASPMFTPPEAFSAGSNPVNGRAADIWSLGIVLYCFVHGRCPFENPSPIELSNQVIHDPLVMSENLSPALIDLLAGMLSKDPRTRTNISKIKVHAWVTNYGKDPMMTTEENCVFEEVTEEEVARAFIPAMVLVDKVFTFFRGRKKSSTPVTQRPRSSQRSRRSNSIDHKSHSRPSVGIKQEHMLPPISIPNKYGNLPLGSAASDDSHSAHSLQSPRTLVEPNYYYSHQSIHANAMSIASTTVAFHERRSAIANGFSHERSRSFGNDTHTQR